MSRERSPFGQCKSCGRAIVWIKTRKGKWMPVLRLRKDGTRTDPRDTFAQGNHEPHFADCPEADEHRRALADPDPPRILGLTLHQPWAWAIASSDKRIENREWAPWCKVGTWIAIHAGKHYDEDAALALRLGRGIVVPSREESAAGAIVAVARYAGTVGEGCQDPWFVGPVGWRLAEVTAIAPVPCRGAQKLWRLPEDVLAQVRAAWAAARRAPPQQRIETLAPDYPWKEQ